MKVLVLAAGGNLGRAVVDRLARDGLTHRHVIQRVTNHQLDVRVRVIIVRPTRLVNAPARGYREAIDVRPPGHFSMSRADVAEFIAKALATCRSVHQAVFLVSK